MYGMAGRGAGRWRDDDDGYVSEGTDGSSRREDRQNDAISRSSLVVDRAITFEDQLIMDQENYTDDDDADEEIAFYELLEQSLYPNNRMERVAAANAHLRERVYPPVSDHTKPRTSREKQWMQEHSTSLYKSQHPGDILNRKSGQNMTPHENFKAHQSDVGRPSKMRRHSSLGGVDSYESLMHNASSENVSKSVSRPATHPPTRKSLAQLAQMAKASKAKATRQTPVKMSLIQTIQSDETLPRRSLRQ